MDARAPARCINLSVLTRNENARSGKTREELAHLTRVEHSNRSVMCESIV